MYDEMRNQKQGFGANQFKDEQEPGSLQPGEDDESDDEDEVEDGDEEGIDEDEDDEEASDHNFWTQLRPSQINVLVISND